MSNKISTIEKLSENMNEASDILKALSSSSRLKIMCLLMDGEKPAGVLAETLDMNLPAISQHLAKMRAHGLVESRRDGQTIYYKAKQGIAQKLVGVLCTHYHKQT